MRLLYCPCLWPLRICSRSSRCSWVAYWHLERVMLSSPPVQPHIAETFPLCWCSHPAVLWLGRRIFSWSCNSNHWRPHFWCCCCMFECANILLVVSLGQVWWSFMCYVAIIDSYLMGCSCFLICIDRYHSKSFCFHYQVFWKICWFLVQLRVAQMLSQELGFYSCCPSAALITFKPHRCGCTQARYLCQLEQSQSFWSILWHPRLCEWCSLASFRSHFQAASFAHLSESSGPWAWCTLRRWSHSLISSASLSLLHFRAFSHQLRAYFYRFGLNFWAYSFAYLEFGLDFQAFTSLHFGFKVYPWAIWLLSCRSTSLCDILGFSLLSFPIQFWGHQWDYVILPICFGTSLLNPSRTSHACSSNRWWSIPCRRVHVWVLVSWIL